MLEFLIHHVIKDLIKSFNIKILREKFEKCGIDVEAKVIPVVMGALGSVPMNLKKKIEVIDVEIPVKLIQKCAMLGPAKII